MTVVPEPSSRLISVLTELLPFQTRSCTIHIEVGQPVLVTAEFYAGEGVISALAGTLDDLLLDAVGDSDADSRT